MQRYSTILGFVLLASASANVADAAQFRPGLSRQAIVTHPVGTAATDANVDGIGAALAGLRSDVPGYAALALGLMLMGRQMRRRSGPRIVPS